MGERMKYLQRRTCPAGGIVRKKFSIE